MKQSKAYLQISNIQFQNSIEQLLKQHFNQKIDLFWEDSLAMIIVYDCDSFVYRLKQAVQMIINDYANRKPVIDSILCQAYFYRKVKRLSERSRV